MGIFDRMMDNSLFYFLFGNGGVLVIILGIVALGFGINKKSEKQNALKNFLLVGVVLFLVSIFLIEFNSPAEEEIMPATSLIGEHTPNPASTDELDSSTEQDQFIESTQTAEPTPPPLTQIYLSELEPYMQNEFLRISTTHNTDNYGNTYSGEAFYNDKYGANRGIGEVEYLIKKEYIKLSGTLYVPDKTKSLDLRTAEFKVYGDGNLLYEYNGLAYKDKPVNFEINITGVEFLVLHLSGLGNSQYDYDPLNSVSNLKLYM